MTDSKPINSTVSLPTKAPFRLDKKFCKTSNEDSYKPSFACNPIITQPGFRKGNTFTETTLIELRADRLPVISKVDDFLDVLLLGYQATRYFARSHKKNPVKFAELKIWKQKKTLGSTRVQRDLRNDFLRSFSQFSN
jgi:hypothetical protein